LPKKLESASLASQVRDRLLQEIKSGRFGNTELLPPEKELAAQFKVSRNTIRAALASLEEDGLVARRKGVGTSIIRSAIGLTTFFDVAKEVSDILQDCGIWATRTILSQKRVVNAQIQAILQLPSGEAILMTEKIWKANAIPLVLGYDYVPTQIIRHSAPPNLWPGSIYVFLEECCEERVEYVRTEVDSVLGDATVNARLEIEAGVPLLHMHSVGFNERNSPLFFSGSYFRSGFLKFSFIRRRA
jgi:GntR family transcriptional regulator